MKKQTLRIVSVLSLLVAVMLTTATAAHAQASRSVVVSIPFEFTVGQKTLPAGDYIVKRATRNSDASLLVQSTDGRRSAMVTTHSVETRATQRKAKLDFHKYGDQFFLARVWTPGVNAGRQINKSSAERALERELMNKAWDNSAARIEARLETVSVIGRTQ